jgi:hypothetical protein
MEAKSMPYANFYFHGCPQEGDHAIAEREAAALAEQEMAAKCAILCPVVDATEEEG